MAAPKTANSYQVAVYFEFREILDRIPTLSELVSLIDSLDMAETAGLLCQMNADFRMTRRDREVVGRLQSELAGSLLDDDTIDRLKRRFGTEHTADRPVFHPVQILNVLRLVIQHSRGASNPLSDTTAKHRVGAACLIMSDLLMSEDERAVLASGTNESVTHSLMVQSLGPFEIQNTVAISHVVYRAQILFHDLLKRTAVLDRIRRECEGFNFEQVFSRIVGIPLTHWLYLLIAFYTYLMHYIGIDGERRPEYLVIERTRFKGQSQVKQAEIDAVLKLISSTPQDLKQALQDSRPTD
jgi:hypothetical protein